MDDRKKTEQKREKFVRLATSRTNNVLKSLDVLRNCANPYSYEYTSEDVRAIFDSIEKKVKEVKQEFNMQLSRKRKSKFQLG